MAHTILEFTSVEFDDNWSKPNATMEYVSTKNGALVKVVAEDSCAAKTTYLFQLKKNSWVQLTTSENLIFIPKKYKKKTLGNKTGKK